MRAMMQATPWQPTALEKAVIQMKHVRFVALAGLIVLMLVPQVAQAGVSFQPDVYVKGGVGVGVHNNTGAGQVKTLRVRQGQAKVVPVWVRNDGLSTDTYFFQGCNGTSRVRVSYTDFSSMNITAAMFSGSYTQPALDSGWSSGVTYMKVKVLYSAPIGYRTECGVIARSAGGSLGGGNLFDIAGYEVIVAAG